MSGTAQRYAAVEAGGTKFLCGVADSDGAFSRVELVPTTSPEETFAAVARIFTEIRQAQGGFAGAGVAAFGPVDLDPASPSYGQVTKTPKAGWEGADILGTLRAATGAPGRIDTDVGAAAFAEASLGASKGCSRSAYVTVGTGIGVGYHTAGSPAPMRPHAEAGHMRVPRAPGDDFSGICPFHGDCLEGLASGPALAARWNEDPATLPLDHEAWVFQAHYVAALCANLTYALRPDRIVLGGGVMGRAGLLERVRVAFGDLLGGYAEGPAYDPQTYLLPPALGEPSSGLVGAWLLARLAEGDA